MHQYAKQCCDNNDDYGHEDIEEHEAGIPREEGSKLILPAASGHVFAVYRPPRPKPVTGGAVREALVLGGWVAEGPVPSPLEGSVGAGILLERWAVAGRVWEGGTVAGGTLKAGTVAGGTLKAGKGGGEAGAPGPGGVGWPPWLDPGVGRFGAGLWRGCLPSLPFGWPPARCRGDRRHPLRQEGRGSLRLRCRARRAGSGCSCDPATS